MYFSIIANTQSITSNVVNESIIIPYRKNIWRQCSTAS